MYQFRRVPFGVKIAGSAFICSVGVAPENKFEKFLTTYVNDFLITTPGSAFVHTDRMCEGFNVLQVKNFIPKIQKSKFCRKRIEFRGYELSIN